MTTRPGPRRASPRAPQTDLMGDGTGILIVDDLVDTGKTLELVRRLYPQAHFATVYAKP